jgi:hypothetical protein
MANAILLFKVTMVGYAGAKLWRTEVSGAEMVIAASVSSPEQVREP